ncbi:signal peptidase II [Demequina sp. SO4-18]|uniref:signal peptidase II n=1 Tax=Demequina sp. SO4-18 TaxID=3401026 RepID=UPI003B59DA60
MTWRPALWLVALAVIALDQVTKQWALSALEPGQKQPVLGDLLSFQLVFNSGAAFSLGDGYTWVMTVIAAVVTVAIVVFARRAQSRLSVALFGIVLGGAIGNLIDRLLREPGFGEGHVVDMINYNGWFVGNVADLAIVGVAAAVLVMSLTNRPLLAPKSGESPSPEGDVPASAEVTSPTQATDASAESPREEPRG